MSELLVGCDPELFIAEKKKTKPRFFASAHGLIPGTKTAPFDVPYGAVQVDGMAVEYNIRPARNMEEFVHNNMKVKEALGEMLPEYTLHPTPVAHFNKRVLSSQPPEALELGCDPDFNAATGGENPRPDGSGVTFRSGGGHIHLGWTEGRDVNDENHIMDCTVMIRQIHTLYSEIRGSVETPSKRSKLYGGNMAFRVKPYGVEYRTPSNEWTKSEDTMALIYLMAKAAFTDLKNGKYYLSTFRSPSYLCPTERMWLKNSGMSVARSDGVGADLIRGYRENGLNHYIKAVRRRGGVI